MEDAYQMYREYSRKYENAVSQKTSLNRKIDSLEASKRTAETDRSEAKKDKINLEKRLEGVKKLISVMEGSGRVSVPATINSSNKTSDSTGENYRGCIHSTGRQAADVASVFHSQSVPENSYSGSALLSFQNEQTNLENAIAEIDRQIHQMESAIESFKVQLRSCSSELSVVSRNINQYAGEKERYRRLL